MKQNVRFDGETYVMDWDAEYGPSNGPDYEVWDREDEVLEQWEV
jgi:hypothetical protein